MSDNSSSVNPFAYTKSFTDLKFAYLSERNSRLEYIRGNETPLRTVGEEFRRDSNKTKPTFPTANAELEDDELRWAGCDYSKNTAGRTKELVPLDRL